jgi:hypothetical protein
MAIAAQTPDILGDRQSGQDVRTQNGALSFSLIILRLETSLMVMMMIMFDIFGALQWWPVKQSPISLNPHSVLLVSTRYSNRVPPLSLLAFHFALSSLLLLFL